LPLSDRLAGLTGPAGWLWRTFCVLLTFHAVAFAWCFFRLTTPAESLACIRACFRFDPALALAGGANNASLWLTLVGYGFLTALAYQAESLARHGRAVPAPLARGFLWGFGVVLLLLALLLSPAGDAPPFIYFQF
jgi:hypothetical protein